MPFYVGGSAGIRNMGTYAAGTTYFPNDTVQYNGSSYIATATTTGNLPTNVTYWSVLAAAGSSGSSSYMPFQTWVSGRVYSPPQVNVAGTNLAYNNGIAGIVFWQAMVPNACSISQVSFSVASSVASSTAVLAMWADEPGVASGGPGTLLAKSADISTATAGMKTVALPYTFTGPTSVWMSLQATSANVGVYSIQNLQAIITMHISAPAIGTRPLTRYINPGPSTSAYPTTAASLTTTVGAVDAGIPITFFTVA